MNLKNIKNLVELLSNYKNHPLAFCKDILGAELMYSAQRDILDSVLRNKRTVVPSGHSTGKTAIEAMITLWWMSTRLNSRIIVTAPTYRQLQRVYYAEVQKWYNNSLLFDLKLFDLKNNIMHINNEELKKQYYMLPISPQSPDALQGQHGDKSADVSVALKELGINSVETKEDMASVIDFIKKNETSDTSDNLLVIIDEASGVSNEILEVLEGTDYAKIIMLGNMTKTSGMFYETVYKNNDLYNVIRLSSYDSPFMSWEQINHIEKKYGKDSNVVKVRLLGHPPLSEDDVVISRSSCEKCIGLKFDVEDNVLFIGVDVARFGDDNTVIYVSDGKNILDTIEMQKSSLMKVSGEIARICKKNKDSKIEARIDAIGIGAGVVDRLFELDFENLEIIEVHNNGKPLNKEEYHDWITEGFFNLKELIENKEIQIPDDDLLIEDLCSRKYEFDSSGRIKVESKKDFKKRVGRSPDKGDAFIQTFKEYDNFKIL